MISGWGLYPKIDAKLCGWQTASELRRAVAGVLSGIARGCGRSYGDSALAQTILDCRGYDHFIRFDAQAGTLLCAAGLSLAEILPVIVAKGWFLPVTPGTKFVTVGGAIASDVHGKNHHCEGSFCDAVTHLTVLLGNGEIADCSPTRNADLFHATCGGMGLTGVILTAEFSLKKIASPLIRRVSIKTASLEDTFEKFETHRDATYSVAWIDCLQTGQALGRSILYLGEHAHEGTPPRRKDPRQIALPGLFPSFLLNRLTMRAFNLLYYHKNRNGERHDEISYDPFFYPLDSIANWNIMYGKRGFMQYQFVVPKQGGYAAMRHILEKIARFGQGSFLAVLKAFGHGNRNLLSFPREGYTLALDFPVSKPLFSFLDELDRDVLAAGGRIYLAKDARMSAATFEAGYPRLEEFRAVRRKYHADRFRSLQAERLGL